MQDGQCTYDVTVRRVRATVAVAEHYVLRTYSVCVCVCVSTASVIQDAKRKGRIILSYVTCPALPNVFRIISKTARLLEKILNIKSVF
jgi:hypothetical protein